MGGPKDDLKWFGESFDGFPRRLPEDCVEYSIFVIDAKLKDLETYEQLRQAQTAGLKLSNSLLKEFIWQRDGIHFDLTRENGRRFLRGRSNHGDSVEDEWLIVYILRELSKQFPNIWINVVDSDGQFLLIEAANALPRWLNPEIADFRVWLNSGRLLVIPLEQTEGVATQPGSKTNLTLEEAIKILEDDHSGLLHYQRVESEAFYRLQKYPAQIADSLHYAKISIPRKVAYILHHSAAYISPAVEAFYLRDPIALRPLQSCDSSKLVFGPTDMVTVSVKFTKVSYAQLKSQQFDPPPAWVAFSSSESASEFQAMGNMGMKVSCGFEMLMSDPQNQDKKSVQEIKILLEDVETGEDQLPTDMEISKWPVRTDDDSWLDINFEDLEKELDGKPTGNFKGFGKGFGDKGTQEHLQKMVARFKDFLDDDAVGAEGAEYLDDMDEDDEEGSTSSENNGEAEDKDISFNQDEFAQMIGKMLGISPRSTIAGNPQNIATSGVKKENLVSNVSPDRQDEEMRQNMDDIENELREAGALELGLKKSSEISKLQYEALPNQSHTRAAADEDAEDEDVDIDVNLATNLLKSLKAQGGMPGPGGNLLGVMGIHPPRDEERED